MSEGLNRVQLMGQLGADGELRFTSGGEPVLSLRIATTEVYFDRDKAKKERTEWHNVTIFGKRGEALSKILRKGSGVFVEGRIHNSSYEDKDGQKRYRSEVVATNVLLTGGRPGGNDGQKNEQPRGRAPAPPPEAAPSDYGGADPYSNDDQIPF